MKTIGTYYIPISDKLIQVTKCEYYEDLFNPPFAIVTWVDNNGIFEKCLITEEQFQRFKRIGSI